MLHWNKRAPFIFWFRTTWIDIDCKLNLFTIVINLEIWHDEEHCYKTLSFQSASSDLTVGLLADWGWIERCFASNIIYKTNCLDKSFGPHNTTVTYLIWHLKWISNQDNNIMSTVTSTYNKIRKMLKLLRSFISFPIK